MQAANERSAYYSQVALFWYISSLQLESVGASIYFINKSSLYFYAHAFFYCSVCLLFHKEKLNFRKASGLLIGFLGMIPTLFATSSLENFAGSIALFSLPEIATLAAVACFGYNLIALQNLVKHRGCPAVLANGISMMLGGFLAFNASLLVEPEWIIGSMGTFLGLLALQILISNIICSNLQASLLKHYSPTFLAFAGFLTPLCAAFYGWFLLGEELYIHYFLSFFLVLIGLIVYYYDAILRNIKRYLKR